MNIQHEQTDSKGSFFIDENGKKLAEMTYSKAGPQMIIIDHTEVSEVLKGKGIGLQLLNATVAYAREKQIKILPLCPFAKSVFDKKPELRDVL
jgi:predicted GNAT family acetyltransferase